METVFLSFSFRDEDRELVRHVETVIESYGLRALTGDALGGEAVTPEIEQTIEESDALIAVATPRDKVGNTDRYTTHPWVNDELKMARAKNKRAIALRHKDVDLKGAWAENEFIDFDPANPIAAFSKLAKTIGKWMREDGRELRVVLDPAEDIGKLASQDTSKCEYRCIKAGKKGPWREGYLANEPGAPVAYIRPEDGKQFEIRISYGAEKWNSAVEHQYIRVSLKKDA